MRSRSVTSRSIASSCGLENAIASGCDREMRSHLAVIGKCDHI
ncbi:hypothetical protein [Moorena producens]